MRFVWRMAVRELRAGWRRLAFFFVCLSVGVGAAVALRSVIQNAGAVVTSEARLLLAADALADSSRQWTPEALQAFARADGSGLVEARTETVDLPTMLRAVEPGGARPGEGETRNGVGETQNSEGGALDDADEARPGALMVELKAVAPPYPLYGEFKLAGGEPFRHELLEQGGVVVAEALLERLSLRVGDAVRIGEATFEIRGSFAEEPGGASGGFRLGPRVFVARDAVEATGLVGFGSRARHRMLFRAREGQTDRLVSELRASLKGTLTSVRSWRDAEESLGEQFERSENYLALTGLVILVLGGIGITNVTRVFVEQKRRTIAVLKCVGATSRRLVVTYLAQTAVLGLAGSLFGVALARLALLFVARNFAESLPPRMSYGLTAGAVWQGLALGLLVTLLFSALPLLRIRNIRPNTLLRDLADDGSKRRRFDPVYWTTAALVVAALVLVSSWQASSLRVGAYFLAGLAVAAGALYGAAALLVLVVRRARRLRSFALRHAVSSLHRPGNQTRTVVMAVGLGVFLVLTVRALQTNLLTEFDPATRGRLPGMYLIDVQPDQRDGVARLIEQATGKPAQLVPTVRARIAAIDGRGIELDAREVRRERGRLGREYVVTYRPALEANETIVEGEFWPGGPAASAEVSIEEGMKGLGGMKLGSVVTFDILGRKVDARVTSVRRVDWRNSRTGFLVLFRPGVLERAPQTFVAPVDGPTDAASRGRFQRELLARYPNVAVIDVTEIVRGVSRLLDNVSLAVSFLGAFVLLSGALILVGSIAMTKWQRVYEAAVLKTLGAKRRDLLAVMLAEYGLLGLVAGLTGAAAAAALSWAVARFVLEIEWSFAPGLAAAGIAATVLLVAAVGSLASAGVLARKPLATLRSQ